MTRLGSLLLLVALPACAVDQAADRANDALDALTAAAEPAYEATVLACLATERLVLARTGEEATWARLRDEIRTVCDAAVASFEAARTAQERARDAVESCREPSAPCVAGALEVVRAAERAFRRASEAWAAAKPVLDRYTGADP